MLSIQEVTKITGLTSRTLRLYEEVGILRADDRRSGGVRQYAPASIDRLKQIIAMKAAGITLRDVSALLEPATAESANAIFQDRMGKLDEQIAGLQERRQALQRYLTTQSAVGTQSAFQLSERERFELFAAARLDVDLGDGGAYGAHLRDELDCFTEHPEAFALIPAVKQVIEFAKSQNIPLGPGRGSSPSSLLFHLIGYTSRDPVKWGLRPAFLFGVSKAIWTDVSYSQGEPVVELCDKLSASLRPWRIEAFRLPLLDIIDNVHRRIGKVIAYDEFADDSPEVLAPFIKGDCENILWFDEPEKTLAARLYPEQLSEWGGFAKMNEYLRSQKIGGFRDLLNIQALRRPKSEAYVARLEEYVQRKQRYQVREQDLGGLRENFGMVIYHEDVYDLIVTATGWAPLRANAFRYRAFKGVLTTADREEFLAKSGQQELTLIENQAPFGFSKAHVVAHSDLVKRCAILKTLHRDIYLAEASRWEDKHGLSWSDFGFHNETVCLLK